MATSKILSSVMKMINLINRVSVSSVLPDQCFKRYSFKKSYFTRKSLLYGVFDYKINSLNPIQDDSPFVVTNTISNIISIIIFMIITYNLLDKDSESVRFVDPWNVELKLIR